MPELFVLQPTKHNRKNPSFRQSSQLLNYNQSTKRPSKNTYQERTEIYYVPETTKNGPIYNKQPHKSPTPSVHSDDLIPDDGPGLYHLPTSERVNRPTARKIYYKPLRYEPKYVTPRNKPLTPPVRKASPVPAPPLTKSTRTPTPPMRKSTPPPSVPVTQSYPTPSPSPPMVTSYQPLTLGAPELYHLDNDKPVYRQPTPVLQQPYKSPSPRSEKSHQTPPPRQEQQPILQQTYPATLGAAELYHLDRVTTPNSPVQSEPKRVEQSYKSPPPSEPLSAPATIFSPPTQKGPQLYHLDRENTEYPPVQEQPKRIESTYKSPPPPVPSAKQSAPPPPASAKLTAPPPTLITGPELYHLDQEDTVPSVMSEEPKHVEQPYKSPPPPPIQAVSPPPQQLMSKLNTPPPQRPELYHMDFNEVDPDPKPVEPSYHSPLPSAKKSSPLPVDVPRPPSQNGPELYHIKVDVSDNPPILQEPPHKTPTPIPEKASPLPTPVPHKPISAPPPSPPQNKPELYYIKLDERPESQATPPSKPATPRVPSGKNRVSPMPSEKSLRPAPEMYHLQTVVDEISRPPSVHEVVTPEKAPTPKPVTPRPVLTKARTPSPDLSPPRPRRRTPTPPRRQRTPPRRQRTPTPPRRRSPVGRPIRTAAPLTLPNRKPKRPIYDDDVDNIPTRRPSFSTALQDVLISDRTVPLSTSKASDSIIRSMNKFRFPEE